MNCQCTAEAKSLSSCGIKSDLFVVFKVSQNYQNDFYFLNTRTIRFFF